MKIIISGYGRMGKIVEEICRQRRHEIVAIIDNPSDWEKAVLPTFDAAVIDFSMPGEAVNNILRCFQIGIPVVTGTTGWYEELEKVKKICADAQGTLFYAPNFSLGVNILFHVNRILAKIMASAEGYRASISETHHIHKLDAPSGTALRLAEDILHENPQLKKWKNAPDDDPHILPVLSFREGEIPGTHEVVYDSETDRISLKHEAKNRKGFALGAVLAAEFIQGKKGIFTMHDYLKTLGL
jgi:4-hydroxy-tetrahydrodipicolinate reductase